MIKGCSKRVVVVKDIESKLFEEAFFIVKSGSSKKYAESEYLNEASRLAVIGSESSAAPRAFPSTAVPARFSVSNGGKRGKSESTPFPQNAHSRKREVLAFIGGFVASSALFVLIGFLRTLP